MPTLGLGLGLGLGIGLRNAPGGGAAPAVATFIANYVNGTATPAGSSPVGTYTYDRNTSPTWITDFEDLVKEIPADAIAMRGQRAVRNYGRDTENLQGVEWATAGAASITSATTWTSSGLSNDAVFMDTATDAPFAAGTEYLVTFDIQSSVAITAEKFRIRLVEDGGPINNVFVAPTTTLQRLSYPITVTGGGGGLTLWFQHLSSGETPATFTLTNVHLEDVTGQTNQNPSEYVSVDNSDDHGSNVDGFKYFPYENGNTVTSNVVDESGNPGATITVPTTNKGVGAWESRANYADTDDDLTGGAETVDLTAGGTGDYTLSVYGSSPAVTVAAGTATGSGFAQATEGSPVTFNLSVAGTVTLTLDSGTLGTDQSGAVYLKQIEKGSFFTPVIGSSGAGATSRNADDLNHDSDNYAETGFCLLDFFVTADQLANHATSPAIITIAETGFVSDWVTAYINDATTVTVDFVTSSGTSTADFTVAAGNRYKIAFTWDKVTGTIRASLDGAAAFGFTGAAAANILATADAATFEVGKYNDTQFWNGNILDVELGKTLMTDAELVSKST